VSYLLKTEPESYSFADLERDHETVWDGVTNPQALKNLRAMKPTDKLVIYHTGDERAAVGTAFVVSVDVSNPKVPVVRIKAGKRLKHPKTLVDIKANPLFATSPLVRQARLSVVPLADEQWEWLTLS
jgi:predicted RNA-binding protein with PUA-like domain